LLNAVPAARERLPSLAAHARPAGKNQLRRAGDVFVVLPVATGIHKLADDLSDRFQRRAGFLQSRIEWPRELVLDRPRAAPFNS
jgi:hypothetical protein